jgi:hypothetical protein
MYRCPPSISVRIDRAREEARARNSAGKAPGRRSRNGKITIVVKGRIRKYSFLKKFVFIIYSYLIIILF